ncbi:hypothetical protein SAY86_021156 [Trapa natans]|uniref:very-long-chain 3-oxoacyl-CoA synthase n=1 Tax=Trapa natans TaxID=22666 RepID=A0AAN7M997_TRANT|nr:hypothetical protein SAY86_021156 [Trapa natans]
MGAEFTFSSMPMPFLAEVAAAIALVALIIVVYFRLGTSYIYLVDFTCYKPPDHLRVPIGMCFEHLDVSNIFDHESTCFQVKVYERSGIGSESCVPESLHELPPNATLVKDLLKVHKNSTALVLSMEAVTPNGYHGKVKSMLLSNVLFRMGGAAILLSNKKQDRSRAKYKLQNLVRSHGGANDEAYESVFQRDDEDGLVGVSLSRALLRVAGKTLTTNIMELGPQVLPYLEMIRYACALLRMRFTHPSRLKDGIPVPNFKKAFEHFCIHAGGRAVIDAVEENLRLHKDDGEASRMTLYRFGNTSSSSVWYELSYLEAKGRVKKGDRVWQIAFGSGFKCNSAVWKCILNLDPNTKNAWSDRIHRYPVEVP